MLYRPSVVLSRFARARVCVYNACVASLSPPPVYSAPRPDTIEHNSIVLSLESREAVPHAAVVTFLSLSFRCRLEHRAIFASSECTIHARARGLSTANVFTLIFRYQKVKILLLYNIIIRTREPFARASITRSLTRYWRSYKYRLSLCACVRVSHTLLILHSTEIFFSSSFFLYKKKKLLIILTYVDFLRM